MELVDQADAAPLLLLIDQGPGAGLRDQAQGRLQLGPAVAAQRSEDVAGEALRVNAHQRRRVRPRVPGYQSHGLLAGVGVPEAVDGELSEGGRKLGARDLSEVHLKAR